MGRCPRGRQFLARRIYQPVGSPGSARTRSSAGPSTSIFRFARGCRWQCFAVARIPLATPGAIRRVRRIVRSRSPGLHQRGGSCRANFFNALLRSAAPLAEQRQRGRRQRHATIDWEGAIRPDRRRQIERSRQSGQGLSCPGRALKSRSDGARLWNWSYTLWRAGGPAICGRHPLARRFARQKLPARSCGRSPLLQALFAGMADKEH